MLRSIEDSLIYHVLFIQGINYAHESTFSEVMLRTLYVKKVTGMSSELQESK